MDYQTGLDFAQRCDREDPLAGYRDQFHFPTTEEGEEYLYLCGNSLGLQPKTTEEYVLQELEDWKKWGVEGHLHARKPWLPYHEFLTEQMASVVGAQHEEVVVMNTLTANLHFMMVSFYRPTSQRYKILIESDAFPSDIYAVESQAKFHGYDPESAVVRMYPREGEVTLRDEDVLEHIRAIGDDLALVMLGGVNYYTGQAFDMKSITEAGHEVGALVGFDLAHAAGNLNLNLHDWQVDFGVWCNYKYMNGGPGAIAGAFVHERHLGDADIPRFNGWWGHDKVTRFKMRDDFDPIPTAEAWQLSNPPILSLAAVRASADMFYKVGMEALTEKSKKLTGYMEFLIDQVSDDRFFIITPRSPERRGCQLSIQAKGGDKSLYDQITAKKVIADWREPDVIRVAPAPFYNSFEDVWRFCHLLTEQDH